MTGPIDCVRTTPQFAKDLDEFFGKKKATKAKKKTRSTRKTTSDA